MSIDSFIATPAHDAWSPVPSAEPQITEGAYNAGGTFDRWLEGVQDGYDASTNSVARHLDQPASRSLSTMDMLRLHVDVIKLEVRVDFTKQIAQSAGRTIDSLTQQK